VRWPSAPPPLQHLSLTTRLCMHAMWVKGVAGQPRRQRCAPPYCPTSYGRFHKEKNMSFENTTCRVNLRMSWFAINTFLVTLTVRWSGALSGALPPSPVPTP